MEVALLANMSPSRQALEQRLQAISTVDTKHQLAFIDTVLGDKAKSEALKGAIDFVKPFFLATAREQLEAEAARVLEKGFRHGVTQRRTLETYLLNKEVPKLHEYGFADRSRHLEYEYHQRALWQ